MFHFLAPYAINAEDSKIFLEHLDSSIKARSHPNVICFVGVCGQGDDLYVAMQLENGQNLRNLLRESRSLDNFSQYAKSRGKISLMSAQRLLSIALGVCRGMGYLEDNKVLHDNLACINIIIGDNGTPKIGGFGMATLCSLYKRQMDRDHEKIRWMPPETLANHVFALKSQVWSFGIVVWEIVTLGGLPYNYLDHRSIMIQIPGGLRLSKPSSCGHKLYEFLFNKIWNPDADARPNFAEILQYFHDFNLNPETHIDLTLVEGFTYEPTKYVPR
uniref:Protein kinase domain-containing protein n=1 Tax=Romanomermis culicivorax TaxID=13658 RepID=A0A915KY08_ROMCU